MSLSANQIAKQLGGYFQNAGSFTMKNIYLLGSPWECDVIRVMKSAYWHEFEIKLSLADYRKDFQKKLSGCRNDSPRKHDLYSSDFEIDLSRIIGKGWNRTIIPKPATFTFVTPVGLIDSANVPAHCGLIEVQEQPKAGWGIIRVKKSPRLKKPSKVSFRQLFNLCQKRQGWVA